MDNARFDTLTRSLTNAHSRRGALGGLLAGALTLLGERSEEAQAHNPLKACKKKSGDAKRKCIKKAKKHNAQHAAEATVPPSLPPPPPPDPCDVCPSGCTFFSVQAAIDANNPQLSTIRVCPGDYVGNLTIPRSLTLIGAGDGDHPPTNTILHGTAGQGSVVTTYGGTAHIQGMRITGGAGATFGGGILSSSTLTVTDCTVTDNSVTGNGGGIDNSGGTLTLNGCTVTDNEAANRGGGIGNSGTTTLNDCTVSGNWGQNGAGGIFNYSGTVTLNNSAVSDNTPNNCDPAIAGCTG
jgi:hypothetical protein